MKKVLIIILHLLEILLILAMHIIHYFTKAKMGMARYMVYFGKKVEAYKLLSFPVVNIVYVVLLILAFVLFIKLYKFIKYESIILFVYSIYSFFNLYMAFKSGARDYYASIIIQSLIIFIQVLIMLILASGVYKKRQI